MKCTDALATRGRTAPFNTDTYGRKITFEFTHIDSHCMEQSLFVIFTMGTFHNILSLTVCGFDKYQGRESPLNTTQCRLLGLAIGAALM